MAPHVSSRHNMVEIMVKKTRIYKILVKYFNLYKLLKEKKVLCLSINVLIIIVCELKYEIKYLLMLFEYLPIKAGASVKDKDCKTLLKLPKECSPQNPESPTMLELGGLASGDLSTGTSKGILRALPLHTKK